MTQTKEKTELDRIMLEFEVSNHHLVEAFAGLGKQISHKNIQKARTASRPISRKLQLQVVDALNALELSAKPWRREDLFPRGDDSLPVP
jgi:hypothetical protein